MDNNDRPDHTQWQCQTVKKPTVLDKIRGKKHCEWINSMRFDICSKCYAKRGVGALAKNRKMETIGELITWDVHGNEIWRYTVDYPGPSKWEYWADDD
jgi:hypothetical protein